MSENERFPGRRPGKSPAERSNFTQACTLLSQFLKEKRNLGVGVSANSEAKEKLETFLPSMTTKNFLNNIENQAGVSSSVKPSGFVQNRVCFSNEDSNKADPRKSKNKGENSQMTIFYCGKVMVFNDLHVDKANDVIALAKSGINSNVNGSVSVSVPEPVVIEIIDLCKSASPEPVNVAGNKKAEININISVDNSDSDCVSNDNNNVKKSGDRTMAQRASEPANGSDLPIARRNSLHRFLEKRKDRVAAKAPYQVPNRGAEAVLRAAAAITTTMAPPRPEEGNSKEAECSEQHLELKL